MFRIFYVHARLGVVLYYILLYAWFLPSFAHYFMKPSAALDNIRINFNSVWRKFNFQCTDYFDEVRYFFRTAILLPRAGHGSVHAHPNFMIFTIFRPLFYETFSSFGQHKFMILTLLEENLTFNVHFLCSNFFRMQFCCPRGHVHLSKCCPLF